MDIDPVINAIKTIAPAAVSPIIHQAQRNETVIKVKKNLGLDPAQPPKDFDGVYAYALVEYGVDKPESLLKFFREKEVKTAFWKAFNDNPSAFVTDAEDFLDWNILGDEIREAKINLLPECEEFYKVFVSVARRSRNPAEAIADPKFRELREQPSYPDEFKALIEEKIKTFCGRQFVFDEFNSFLKKHNKGYFTVIGDAGMGKSALAAKYVYDNPKKTICYFNIFAEGLTSSDKFLESIRKQVINCYHLQNAEDADLGKLLVQVSQKLNVGERLVVVVDALDEVEQKAGGNLLNLPTTLPDNVYFMLTRRPYIPSQKRLFVSPGIPVKELDLTSEYVNKSREDIKEYISFSLNHDSCEYKDGLNKWIQDRKDNITLSAFIEQVADKSENNFMYLRFVLPDIAEGKYDDLNYLKQLPDGLQVYYETHWERMGMTTSEMRPNAIILYVLVEAGKPISCGTIASITGRNEDEVEEVLQKWTQFLRRQRIKQETCYSMYHKSFTDFLRDKPTLKKNRVQLQDIQRLICDENDRLWEELEKVEEEGEDE